MTLVSIIIEACSKGLSVSTDQPFRLDMALTQVYSQTHEYRSAHHAKPPAILPIYRLWLRDIRHSDADRYADLCRRHLG
jgi:hypothetical protein